MSFLIENLGTILVAAVLAGIVALIIVKMLRDRKKGQSSCGCACSWCPASGSCHKTNS